MVQKITIEDLALMVQRGFEETAKKADADKRFDAIETELIDIKEEIRQMRIELQKA